MQTYRLFNFLSVMLFATMLSLPLAAVAGGNVAQNGSSQTQRNDELVIHLGKVTVKGEKHIVETLQEIKVALRRPESSDPKLKNVVVCRLTNQTGSHDQQILTCATNAGLAARRNATQLAMAEALSNPTGPGSEDSAISELNEMLASQRGGILQAPVNGPAFRALLQKIPLPAATTAPSAATHH